MPHEEDTKMIRHFSAYTVYPIQREFLFLLYKGSGVLTVLMEESEQNLIQIPANSARGANMVNQPQVIHIQQQEDPTMLQAPAPTQQEPIVKTKKKTKRTLPKQSLNCQWCKKVHVLRMITD